MVDGNDDRVTSVSVTAKSRQKGSSRMLYTGIDLAGDTTRGIDLAGDSVVRMSTWLWTARSLQRKMQCPTDKCGRYYGTLSRYLLGIGIDWNNIIISS